MKQKIKIRTVLCSVGLALLVGLPFVFNIAQNIFVTKADEPYEGTGSAVNYDANFFSSANTYTATIKEEITRKTDIDIEYGTEDKYNSVSFDTENKREDVIVSDDAPQVTFITHGLAGRAAHWSNNSGSPDWEFAYSAGSIIDLLQQKADCNIYWVHFTSINDFDLIQLDNDNYGNDSQVYIDNITDNSKHSIVIFDGHNTWQSNDYIYTQFNIMASKVVLDLQALDANNELPRVNLIGHSRGGLTNLQYALDHPDLVDSIFSLGTPYLGSTSASIDNYILGGALTNNSVGEDDITDSEVYLDYLDQWNNNYTRLYQNINVYALGGYQSIDMLIYQIMYPSIVAYLENDIVDVTAKALMKALNIFLSVRFGLLNNNLIPNVIKQEIIAGILDIVYRFIPTLKNNTTIVNGITAALDLLFDELQFNPLTSSYDLLNDGIVDLPSQLGLDQQSNHTYIGFNRFIKRFGVFGEYNLNKSSVDNLRVTHNLEARDETLLTYIVKRINMSYGENGSPYLVVDVSTAESPNSISIIGYIGKNIKGTLTIPETIYFDDGDGEETNNNKTVVSIGAEAFANNMNGETDITGVIIPKTVKTIASGAFYNNEYLETLSIDGANEGISNLTEISAGAFSYISHLSQFFIPKNVDHIEAKAFVGCTALSNLTVDTANTYFSSNDGVLFNKLGTQLLYYPEGKTGTTYSVPSSVTEIAPFAFLGNSNLTNVNLNNVDAIRQYAFSDCNELSSITAPNLNFIEIGIFDGTKWLENQESDIVKLGNVLVLYQGTASELSIEDVISIAPMAFADNAILESVTLHNELVNIGDGAFYGCSNLETVNICNYDNLVFVSNSSFSNNAENRKIYVPQPLKNEYLSNELWGQYEEAIEVHQTNITFEANGGNCDVTMGSVYYQDYLTLPTPSKEGYFFDGWYDNPTLTGEALNEQTPWDSLSDGMTLYAKWTPLEYLITYNTNGGVFEEVDEYYTTEDSIIFAIPTRAGYTFSGWYYDEALTLNAGTGFSAGEVGDKTVYAKWTADTYTVTLNFNDDAKDPASATANSATVTFGQPYTLPTASRNGYIFNGWRTVDGVLYTLENGTGFKVWDIPSDTTLYADWTRKKFYIKVNANGTISWLGLDGFSDEQTPIEYGAEFMTATEIEQAFNPQKISYKEGHKFTYFTLEDGTKFTSWTEIPDLGADGRIITIEANFTKESNFYIMYNGYTVEAGVNPLQANYGDSIDLMVPNNVPVGYVFKYWKVALVEDVPYNEKYLNSGTLKPGSIFEFDYMPDLSVGVEADGDGIYLEAYFEPLSYTVQFDTTREDVANPASMNITYGTNSTLPVVGALGRTFDGWYTQPNGAGTCIANSSGVLQTGKWNITNNTTLYAKWTVITYTITYHLNGGTYNEGESNPTTYTIDTETFTLVDPVYENERFMGWFSNENLTEDRVYSIPKGSTGDIHLYADWEMLFTLQFSENGYINSYLNIQGIKGETVTLPNYSNKGYTWSGYEMGASYTITADRIFYLTEKSLSATYNSSTGYYEIWTYGQLNSVRNYRSSKHKLMTSITIPEDTNWVPIPTFTGTFDGNNYWINDLTIEYGLTGSSTTVTRVNYGLFEENQGTIKNLGISQGAFALYKYTATYSNVPVYCGFIAAKNSGTISYCDVFGSFFDFAYIIPETESRAGAICGYNTGRVEYCKVFETGVQLTTGFGGGVVGHNKGGTVTHCEIGLSSVSCYKGFRSDTENGYSSGHYGAAGGIVGYAEGGTISYCDVAADVDVDYDGYSSDSKSLAPELGIIAGRSTSSTIYTSNVADGETGAFNGLNVITWTTGMLWWKETHTWDQGQYVGGTVGRYV